MIENSSNLTIGKLSKYSGIHVKALRYYESIGILNPVAIDENNGYRYFSYAHIPYVKIIKLCANYEIPLKTFNEFIESDNEINLLEIVRTASSILEKKKNKIEQDSQFLSSIEGEINLSNKLHLSNKVEIKKCNDIFILVPFHSEFFSVDYYVTINKTISMLNNLGIEFYNRIGCYYDLEGENCDSYLAIKIRGEASQQSNLRVLHLDHLYVEAQHIDPDKITDELIELKKKGKISILILETYEAPYNVLNPHLELRVILGSVKNFV